MYVQVLESCKFKSELKLNEGLFLSAYRCNETPLIFDKREILKIKCRILKTIYGGLQWHHFNKIQETKCWILEAKSLIV